MMNQWALYKEGNHKEKFLSWLKWAGLSKKDYQISANDWCENRENIPNYKGGILADEMGLGKTIIMLGRIFTNPVKRTLIILPLPLLLQWKLIIEDKILGIKWRWLSKNQFYIFHGSNKLPLEELRHKRIIITTYGTMISQHLILKRLFWHRIIFDEAHHLRNMNTRNFRCAKELRGGIRWLVTGTPIQNKISDFYALCSVLGFGVETYGTQSGKKAIIKNCVLRRTKKGVGLQLPPIKYYKQIVPWDSTDEEELSSDIHAAIPSHKSSDITSQLDLNQLAVFTRSRQMCTVPPVILDAIERGDIDPKWFNLSKSKLNAVCNRLVKRSQNNKNKLVFCYYHKEIDILAAMLQKKGITVKSIDGRTKKRERQEYLQKFLSKKEWNDILPIFHTTALPIFKVIKEFLKPQVLLVQIQTMCEGLNLQDFSEVYFTSPSWNPALEDQAVARCYRLGQKHRVKVFRFIMETHCNGGLTLDQYCRIVQNRKRLLFNETFQ